MLKEISEMIREQPLLSLFCIPWLIVLMGVAVFVGLLMIGAIDVH